MGGGRSALTKKDTNGHFEATLRPASSIMFSEISCQSLLMKKKQIVNFTFT